MFHLQLEKANTDIERTERQIRKQQEKMGSYAALHATEKNAKAQRFGAARVQVRVTFAVTSYVSDWYAASQNNEDNVDFVAVVAYESTCRMRLIPCSIPPGNCCCDFFSF